MERACATCKHWDRDFFVNHEFDASKQEPIGVCYHEEVGVPELEADINTSGYIVVSYGDAVCRFWEA